MSQTCCLTAIIKLFMWKIVQLYYFIFAENHQILSFFKMENNLWNYFLAQFICVDQEYVIFFSYFAFGLGVKNLFQISIQTRLQNKVILFEKSGLNIIYFFYLNPVTRENSQIGEGVRKPDFLGNMSPKLWPSPPQPL